MEGSRNWNIDARAEMIDHRQWTQALAFEIEAGVLGRLSLHGFHSGVFINVRNKNVKNNAEKA